MKRALLLIIAIGLSISSCKKAEPAGEIIEKAPALKKELNDHQTDSTIFGAFFIRITN